MKPRLIVIGGANGSGKTTLAREFLVPEDLTYLAADDIAREINPQQVEAVAIEAARIFSRRFGEFLAEGKSLVVESTLSGLSMGKWLKKARGLGYEIEILFVYLDSPELCVRRVAARVAKGGHRVPEADIRRRFARSNFNFWHSYQELADTWFLFLNSGESFEQIANGDANGMTILDDVRYEQWREMIR